MIKNITFLKLLFFMCNSTLFSQTNTSTDSSYTIHSAYKKVIKSYPSVTIANARPNKNVKRLLNIPYKTFDKDTLLLDAFLTKKNNSHPAIILVHGGGWKSGSKELLNPLAETLAAHGFNSFSINYRLAPQHKFPKAVCDVYDAISFIKKHADTYQIDPNKIVVLGSSSGAQTASLVATAAHNKIFSPKSLPVQGLINIDGIIAFSHPKSEEGTLAASWIGATESDNPELWQKASALTYVDKFSPPTLFIPSDFERFQAGREDMISILKQNNIYYKVEPVHNAPHTFWLFNPWFDDVSNSIINFLNFIFK